MSNIHFGLTQVLCLFTAFFFISSEAHANPGERSVPVSIESLVPPVMVAPTAPLIENFSIENAAGNTARRAGDLGSAKLAYLRALKVATQTQVPTQIWLAGSNLLSLHATAGALYNPQLAVVYGKMALNALSATKSAVPRLFEQHPDQYDESPAQSYHLLGSQLLQLQRYDEARLVMQAYKQQELEELFNGGPVLFPAKGLQLTEQDVQHQIEQGIPSVNEATVPASLRSFAGLLPREEPGTVRLDYFVTGQQVSILVSSAQGSFTRTKDYSQKDLDRQIVALRLALSNRLETRPAATELWRVLIEPVGVLLKQLNAQTVELNLTGRLRYLPFAALQDPQGRFLIEDYALVNATAAIVRNLSSSNPISRIDALGLSQARMGQSALPGVKEEIQAIVKSPRSPQGLLKGTLALDEEFTSARFANALRGENNVLHVATHFKFRPGNARQSLLYMGQGEPLNLIQLSEMDYSKLDLLTLSACETAVGGGVDEHGMEVEGLAASVLKAGARSVMGSLWSVSDQSTGLLMKEFYGQRSAGASSNAEALRQAQLRLAKSQKSGFKHPFFWSAFTVSET